MLLNRDRALELMERDGVDALIGATPENVTYLSGMELHAPFLFGGTAYAIFPFSPDVPPTLIVPEYALAYLAERPASVPNVVTFGTFSFSINQDVELQEPELGYARALEQTEAAKLPQPGSVLLRTLGKLGLGRGRLAVDDPILKASLSEQESLHGQIVQGSELFREIRAIKTPDEVQILKTAAITNEASVRDAMGVIRAGANWREVQQAWEAGMWRRGAVPRFWMSGAGRRASGLFPELDYTLERGDIVRFECGGQYRHYWADTGRTVSLGAPSQKLQAYYGALREARSAAEAVLRPGVLPRDVVSLMIDTIRDNGLPGFEDTAWGHGLGLQVYDLPAVNITSNQPLEAGIVFALETPYFELGWGGIQLEDSYHLTSDGFERLTELEQDLYVIDG